MSEAPEDTAHIAAVARAFNVAEDEVRAEYDRLRGEFPDREVAWEEIARRLRRKHGHARQKAP